MLVAVVNLLNDCSSHLGRQHLQQPLHRRLGKPATSEARDATYVLQNLHERQHQSANPRIAKTLTVFKEISGRSQAAVRRHPTQFQIRWGWIGWEGTWGKAPRRAAAPAARPPAAFPGRAARPAAAASPPAAAGPGPLLRARAPPGTPAQYIPDTESHQNMSKLPLDFPDETGPVWAGHCQVGDFSLSEWWRPLIDPAESLIDVERRDCTCAAGEARCARSHGAADTREMASCASGSPSSAPRCTGAAGAAISARTPRGPSAAVAAAAAPSCSHATCCASCVNTCRTAIKR